VHRVIEAYEKWNTMMEGVAQRESQRTKDRVKDLGMIGLGPQLPQVEKFLGGISGVTGTEARAAFAGVHGAAPGASLSRRLELAQEAVRIAPLAAGDEEKIKTFAGLTGAIGVAAPQKSARAASDLALAAASRMTTAGGGEAAAELSGRRMQRAIQTLGEAGMSPEQSIAWAIEAAKKRQEPRTLASIAEKLIEPMEVHGAEIRGKTGRVLGYKPMGPEQQKKADFGKATPAERLKMLRADPLLAEEILGKQGVQFARLDPAAVEATARELQADENRGMITAELRSFGATETGRDVLADREVMLTQRRSDAAVKRLAEARQREHEVESALVTQKTGNPISYGVATAGLWMSEVGASFKGGSAADFSTAFLRDLNPLPPSPGQVAEGLQLHARAEQWREGSGQVPTFGQGDPELKAILKSIDQNTRKSADSDGRPKPAAVQAAIAGAGKE